MDSRKRSFSLRLLKDCSATKKSISNFICTWLSTFWSRLWSHTRSPSISATRNTSSEKRAPVSWPLLSTSYLISFDCKYYNLKYNVFDILNKILLNFFDNKKHQNSLVINAIFKFYSELNSAFQISEIIPFLLRIFNQYSDTEMGVFFSLDGVKVR